MGEPAKAYDPKSVEKEVYERWIAAGAFNAEPADAGTKYCIVIPPPNVTAALHLGHALNNTLQDVLVRVRRMQGYNALWMPGTDHAGIATQTVVEKRILTEEGKRRTDFERSEFVTRIQAWKDEYERRIITQLKTMGCSCDWRRKRFTMDETCAKAVRETFFKLFSDGLIYRGKRLVNWDPATQTVLADDEVEHEEVNGHFYYLKYPLAEPVVVSGMGVPPMRPTAVPAVDEQGIDKRQGAYLPHWAKAGATYAVTFRLADCLPAHVLEGWKREREDMFARAKAQNRQLTAAETREIARLFSERIERHLDIGEGACHLRDEQIAKLVQEALLHFDGQRYDLIAWCVMPNHVHVVVAPREDNALSDILHSWKSFTAKEANKVLGLSGPFWQEEYYDHLIRDEEDFNHALTYIFNNPSNAGLANWPWLGSRPQQHTQGQDGPATHGRDAHATANAHATITTITHITVATTRPETMLGDTAVAMNPTDPRAKYLVGKMVRLPIVGRLIPIIADDHVVLPNPDGDDPKAKISTGFLKVTPAHDPDDYAIRQRHPEIDMINIMAPDGTISYKHGWTDWETVKNPDVENFIGMDRFEARKAVISWLREENLVEKVIDYVHQVGHSYRSHAQIEPYLSDQWYVAVKKPIPNLESRVANRELKDAGASATAASCAAVPTTVPTETKDGVTYIKDTNVPVNSLAGLALMPLLDGGLKFTPDRYANNYRAWLENLRDWPISRQLWWGHQIPVWSKRAPLDSGCVRQGFEFFETTPSTASMPSSKEWIRLSPLKKYEGQLVGQARRVFGRDDVWVECYACVAPGPQHAQLESQLEKAGFRRDSDVLDTWFSSALWPFSTLGWPDENESLAKWYPGDVLCTAREIITLWVSRMVMMGQYCVGKPPFTDVFIHAMIQDGDGRKMSKSLGNGIDPLDIIDSHGADAMRFTLVSMTTQTQDVRMPVEKMTLPDGREMNTSPKFDAGRNFANKLWNASRFAMMNLAGMPTWAEVSINSNLADQWIISRLHQTIRDATAAIDTFRYNELADALYHFMWDDLCDWYLEIAKGRINAGQTQPRAVVAYCLDSLLRLLHPIMPFITEAIWTQLNAVAPNRGPADAPAEPMLIKAAWPLEDSAWINLKAEADFDALREIVRGIRNVRTQHNVPPSKKVGVIVHAAGAAQTLLSDNVELLKSQANLESVAFQQANVGTGLPVPPGSAAVAVGEVKLYVLDIIDRDAELTRLTKQAETLRRGIAGIEGKLGNEGFLAKAPPAVVAKERQRLEGFRAELAAVDHSLASLK